MKIAPSSKRTQQKGTFVLTVLGMMATDANAKNAFIQLTGSYMLLHNVFLDLDITKRNFNSELAVRDLNSSIFSTSLRWNIAKRQHEFWNKASKNFINNLQAKLNYEDISENNGVCQTLS